MQLKTVWTKVIIETSGTRHTRRVDVVAETGHVNITALTVGPRGGGSLGMPGFTKEEWAEVVAAVSAEVAHV
jgi:hypothetical protein